MAYSTIVPAAKGRVKSMKTSVPSTPVEPVRASSSGCGDYSNDPGHDAALPTRPIARPVAFAPPGAGSCRRLGHKNRGRHVNCAAQWSNSWQIRLLHFISRAHSITDIRMRRCNSRQIALSRESRVPWIVIDFRNLNRRTRRSAKP